MSFLTPSLSPERSRGTIKTMGEMIVYQKEEIFPEEVVVIGHSDEVTEKDILIAEDFGVMAGLKRHLNNAPEKKAEAALQIMEAIYAHGYKEKVWLFIRAESWPLCSELNNQAIKAAFAIRTCKMLRIEEQAKWLSFAVSLLSNEKVIKECSKESIETLALIFANVSDLKQTLYWLEAAQSKRQKYKEGVLLFFLKGAFEQGLYLIEKAPGNIICDYTDFIELLTYGLRNSEILKESVYCKAILSYTKDWEKATIILKALCYFNLKGQAIDLAEKMALKEDSNSVYWLLNISDYFQGTQERQHYLNRLVATAIELNKRKATHQDCLYDVIKHDRISVKESLEICVNMERAYWRAKSLWERACCITLKSDSNRFKNLEELREDLRSILLAMRKHLILLPFKDDSHPPYWVKVIRQQIDSRFFEDIEKTGSMWEEWVKSRGPDWQSQPYNASDIWFLSYWGLFQWISGKKEEGLNSFQKAYWIQKQMWERDSGNSVDNFSSMIKEAAKDFSPFSYDDQTNSSLLDTLKNFELLCLDQLQQLLLNAT